MSNFLDGQGVVAAFVVSTTTPLYQIIGRNVQAMIVKNGVGDCTINFVDPVDFSKAVVTTNLRSNVSRFATVEVDEPGGAFVRVRGFTDAGVAAEVIVDVKIEYIN